MPISVTFVDCGEGTKNKLDHAALGSSEQVWDAITGAAREASRFPQSVLWKALDPNLRGHIEVAAFVEWWPTSRFATPQCENGWMKEINKPEIVFCCTP